MRRNPDAINSAGAECLIPRLQPTLPGVSADGDRCPSCGGQTWLEILCKPIAPQAPLPEARPHPFRIPRRSRQTEGRVPCSLAGAMG